jgi:hypothetical protein
MKGFKGEAYWIFLESNSRPPANLLSDSLPGALSLLVIGGSGKIERVEGNQRIMPTVHLSFHSLLVSRHW